jgi:hypothetical protein
MTREIKRRARARRALPPVYELGAYSVYGFCLAHGLSRRKLYYMLEAAEGPRIMKCGTRTLISVEWRPPSAGGEPAIGGNEGAGPALAHLTHVT